MDCKPLLTCLVTAGPSLDMPITPQPVSSRSPPHQQGLTQQEPQEPWSLICPMVGQLDHCSRASKVSGRSMSSPNATLGKRRTITNYNNSLPAPERLSRVWLSPAWAVWTGSPGTFLSPVIGKAVNGRETGSDGACLLLLGTLIVHLT